MNGIITPAMVITGLGSIIGRYFQDRTERIAQYRKLRESEIKGAINYAENISGRIDSYMYHAKTVCDSYKHKLEKKEIEKNWKDFVKVNTDWEKKLNVEIATVGAWFGENMRVGFEDAICRNLIHLRKYLDDLYYREKKEKSDSGVPPEAETFEKFKKLWNRMNDFIREFNTQLLRLIKAENIGALRRNTTSSIIMKTT
jgi:hypothetical protein